MSYEDDPTAVVIDLGSATLRAGLAGDDAPRVVFPTVIGRPETDNPASTTKSYVGDAVESCPVPLSVHRPMERGVITDWDGLEEIVRHTYGRLGTNMSELPLLVSEAVYTPAAQRERLVQFAFETLEVPAFYASPSSVLALYTAGRSSAVIVESGEGVTQITPFYESLIIRHAVKRLDFAGQDLTDYLSRLLQDNGYSFTTPAEMDVVRRIKEQCCYVAQDFDREMTSYSMRPDAEYVHRQDNHGNTTVKVGDAAFRCPEAMFSPKLAGQGHPGIHQLIGEAIAACDVDTRPDMKCAITLSGGNTMCAGFPERLKKELGAILPENSRFMVRSNDQKYGVWIGGSILGSLSAMGKMWVTKHEYEETGPGIAHRKMF